MCAQRTMQGLHPPLPQSNSDQPCARSLSGSCASAGGGGGEGGAASGKPRREVEWGSGRRGAAKHRSMKRFTYILGPSWHREWRERRLAKQGKNGVGSHHAAAAGGACVGPQRLTSKLAMIDGCGSSVSRPCSPHMQAVRRSRLAHAQVVTCGCGKGSKARPHAWQVTRMHAPCAQHEMCR